MERIGDVVKYGPDVLRRLQQGADEDERERAAWDRADAIQDTKRAVPERFRWATFRDRVLLEQRIGNRIAIGEAERAVAAQGMNAIVLVGPAGCGKTALGCAMLRRSAKLHGRRGAYTSVFELRAAEREHRLGYGAAPELLEAETAPVLFLDELGCEVGQVAAVDDVIRARHDRARPTIFATPHGQDEIAGRYGDGIARRVFEGAVVINLGGAA
jgi:DNA replication protein DnaC